MKFLVDAHIGKLISAFLQQQGHDVLRATSFSPGTSDMQLLRLAAAEERVIVTSDKDFGELVYRLDEPAFGVLLLRIDVPTEADRLRVIETSGPALKCHYLAISSR